MGSESGRGISRRLQAVSRNEEGAGSPFVEKQGHALFSTTDDIRPTTYDRLPTTYYSPMTSPRYSFSDLLSIMERLRAPGGCPWDREQTHASLLPYLIEEAYEFIDAAESGDANHMREELGDVLLQVVFHAQVAREAGTFDI